EGFPGRVGNQGEPRRELARHEVPPGGWFIEGHQSAASALLAGFYDRSTQFLQLGRTRLYDTSRCDQRNEATNPQLGGLLDEPCKAVCLRNGGTEGDVRAGLFGMRASRPDRELDRFTVHARDLRLGLVTLSVE